MSGLPQMCFDAALLWQPWRVLSRRVSSYQASEAVLPSWSWVGWAGDFSKAPSLSYTQKTESSFISDSESWRSAAGYMPEVNNAGQRSYCSWRTINTVEWSYSLTQFSTREKITNSPIISQQIHDYDGKSLPLGWSKFTTSEAGIEHLYYHKCDPSQPFQYPVPIQDENINPTPPISARYLHCSTFRSFLRTGVRFRSPASRTICVDLLVPDTSAWAGVLRLNHALEDATEGTDESFGETVELIEISAGSVEDRDAEKQSFEEWEKEICSRSRSSRKLYEFYNVLWISWKVGVAYRNALGRVEKHVWEGLNKERIDVVLG